MKETIGHETDPRECLHSRRLSFDLAYGECRQRERRKPVELKAQSLFGESFVHLRYLPNKAVV